MKTGTKAGNWSSGTIASRYGSTATFNTTGSGAITVIDNMAGLALKGIVLGGGFSLSNKTVSK